MRTSLGLSVLWLLVGTLGSVSMAAPDSDAKGSCQGAGPQAPRDITSKVGENQVSWPFAEDPRSMNLCNIHFHRFAEHKGPEYGVLAGEGDHQGYRCNDSRPPKTRQHTAEKGQCKNVMVGDTIEVHWVFTSCDVDPGQGLGACMSDTCKNPSLRVEARVFTVSEAKSGVLDFNEFDVKGRQPKNYPPSEQMVRYLGSTTGPSYTENACSPLQVSWSVSGSCYKVSKSSLDQWCSKNVFQEDHAHGVRKIVKSPKLLDAI